MPGGVIMFGATRLRALKATTGLAAVATTFALWAPPALATTPVNLGGTTHVLSVDAAGTTLGGRAPSVSRDGRYTAYSRAALVNNDWGIGAARRRERHGHGARPDLHQLSGERRRPVRRLRGLCRR